MTGCAHLFSSYTPNSGQFKVRIADGSLSPIARIGTTKINSTLVLKSVLYVPNLSCNLLYVSKMSKDCDCKVIFSQDHCEFQDRSSGKRIGNASEHGGLYSRLSVPYQRAYRFSFGTGTYRYQCVSVYRFEFIDIFEFFYIYMKNIKMRLNVIHLN